MGRPATGTANWWKVSSPLLLVDAMHRLSWAAQRPQRLAVGETHGHSTPNDQEAAQRRHRRGGTTSSLTRSPNRRRRCPALPVVVSLPWAGAHGYAPPPLRGEILNRDTPFPASPCHTAHQLADLCRDQRAEPVAPEMRPTGSLPNHGCHGERGCLNLAPSDPWNPCHPWSKGSILDSPGKITNLLRVVVRLTGAQWERGTGVLPAGA